MKKVISRLPFAWVLYAAVLISLFSLYATAETYQSHQLDAQVLTINTDTGKVTLTAYNELAIEVHYQPSGVKQIQSFAIAGEPENIAVNVKENPRSLAFSTGKLTAKIAKQPLRIQFFKDDELLLEEEVGFFLQDTVRGFRFNLQPEEKLIGGGQRVLGMDRRGHRMPLYNRAHYGYTTESNQMYFGLSAVMSNKKYALVFDNSASGYMDLGKTESTIMQFEAVSGRTSYLVIAGNDYPHLIDKFTQVTGRQPLPPRWALGNFASRFGYHTQQETQQTVDKFLAEDFPLDAVVLDLYWFGPDIKGHMGNLEWDKQAFPEPEKMIRDFQKQGVDTILITEPFVLTSSKKWDEAKANNALAINHAGAPKTFDFYFGNTGLIDVFSPTGQSWFEKTYQQLFKQGVTGWWGDLGEPEVHPADALHQLNGKVVTGDEIHNAYGHQWAEMVYQTQRELSNDIRPMIMMRSGFVGSQRYGMIPWTGDVSRSWDGLKPQVELNLQMGLLGLAYTHSDLGGFAGGEVFDKEMYIRWLQYGVFQPVYRPHAQEQIAPEPVFHDEQTKDIIREYIKLRYQLLPYNYSLVYENSLTGMPLMRPMMFENENDATWFDEKDQYFWGNSFLVKPVTEAGANSVKIRLPEGVWFNYWSNDVYQGDQTVDIATDLQTLPVLVRGGAFIPTVAPIQNTKQYNSKHLVVDYYAHNSVRKSQGIMYEDNGVNPQAIDEKQYQTITFESTYQANKLSINMSVKGSYAGAPVNRLVEFRVNNWLDSPTNIKVGSENLTMTNQSSDNAMAANQFYFDKINKVLTITVALEQHQSIEIN